MALLHQIASLSACVGSLRLFQTPLHACGSRLQPLPGQALPMQMGYGLLGSSPIFVSLQVILSPCRQTHQHLRT